MGPEAVVEAGLCWDADLDAMDGLGVDAAGRLIVAGRLYGGTPRHATLTTFMRTLVHRSLPSGAISV
jgi:hypothetical protein